MSKDIFDPTSTYEQVDMTDVQTETRAVRLNASKRIIGFLEDDWLQIEGFWRKAKLRKILGQMAPWAGFNGELTVFEDRAPHHQKVAKNVVIISEDGRDAFLRIYNDTGLNNEETECTIPGYNPEFDHSFVLIQDEVDSVIGNNPESANVFTFWDINYDDFVIIPRFKSKLLKVKQERTLLAKLCTEIAPPGKDMVRATFTVERFSGRLGFTLKIPNDPEIISSLDSYTDCIMVELDSKDQNQHAQHYYSRLKRVLEPICKDFLVEIFNRDNTCINRFVVKDGVPFSFMVQKDQGEFVTAYKNGDWEYKSPTMSAEQKTVQVDVPGTENKSFKKELNISVSSQSEEETRNVDLITLSTELKVKIEDFIGTFSFVFE